MKAKTAALRIQKWGNSLAVRIPAAIARSAHFDIGTQVEVAAHEDSITVRYVGAPKLSLAERLKRFDSKIHGGETMSDKPVGKEKL